MKLLVDSIFTSPKMSKCSTYYALKNAGLSFLENNPDGFVYCTIPDTNTETKWDNNDLVENERWKNIPIFYGKDRYQNMFFPKADLLKFSHFGQYWDWDYLITTRNNGWYWRFMINKSYVGGIKKLLILVEPFPMMTFKKIIAWDDEYDRSVINSYLAFDYIFIQAEWEKQEILRIAKKMLSPQVYLDLSKKFITTFPKPNIDYNFPMIRKNDYTKEAKLVYVQRLDEFERRATDMLDVLRTTFISGGIDKTPLKVFITTNSEKGIDGDVKFLSFDRLPRDQFYELLKTMDIWLSWSIDEGMPFSLLEATAFGVIPIAKKEKWSEDFLGKDYWGLVDNKEEAIAKIKWIIENRDKAYSQFLEWYQKDFSPRLISRGNQFEVQQKLIQTHKDYIEKTTKERVFTGVKSVKISDLIAKGNVELVDLNNKSELSKIDGVRLTEDTVQNEDIPFSRLGDMYNDRLRLLFKNGYIDTGREAVLKKIL